MKRTLACSLLLTSAAVAIACSSSSNDGKGATPPAPPTTRRIRYHARALDDGGTTTAPEAGPPPGTEDPSGIRILFGTPRVVRSFTPPGGTPYFVDGPQWSAVRSQLFVSLPFAANLAGGRGILTRSNRTARTTPSSAPATRSRPASIGNSVDKRRQPHLRRAQVDHAHHAERRGRRRSLGHRDRLHERDPDAAAAIPFDTPNDLVALDDGTIYVTTPATR